MAMLGGASAGTSLGEWTDDENGLPCYRYTGPLTFHTPNIPDDPHFLLGNHRLTLFVHASGRYEILTGERAWARMNGPNEALVEIGGQRHELIGDAEAPRVFGIGFARYEHRVTPELTVTRTLTVRPSRRPGEGTSAFVVTVRLGNTGVSAVNLTYSERVLAHYEPILAPSSELRGLVKYTQAVVKEEALGLVRADVHAEAKQLLGFAPAGQMSRFDSEPPSLFLKTLTPGLHVSHDGDWMGIFNEVNLDRGAIDEISFVVGYTRDAAGCDALAEQALQGPADEWLSVVPAFASETDAQLRREMRWNAGTLEAMATWREYYNETVVPQGTVYDYAWGQMLSSRDLAQHALPLCHTNPALARSVLRFIMKRMLPDGEVKLSDEGFGWAAHGAMLTSDQQLWFLMLMAEYLRVTKDVSILTEQIGYYPLERSATGTGLDRIREAFLFLRDRIGVGVHGLVKLWNSDWNDMFYFWPTNLPYNRMFASAESSMNTAMAVAILADVAEMLQALAPEEQELWGAMTQYRLRLARAFLLDLGTRTFPRRARIRQGEVYGENDIWLEPVGFAMLMPEFSEEKRRVLFGEVQARLLKGEAMGARQIEKPVPKPGTNAGSRENGGFWYALNGPLILGVATFDRAAAMDLLKRMTFENFAGRFPQYWTGRWSASDSLDSSLLPSEGLSENPIYCAHAHAWPLYCYLRLTQT
jgi:cellobiose phosphorylase